MTWECQECGAECEQVAKPVRCSCGAHNWQQMVAPTWFDVDQGLCFNRMLLDRNHPDAVQDILTGRWMESDAAFSARIKADLARKKDSK